MGHSRIYYQLHEREKGGCSVRKLFPWLLGFALFFAPKAALAVSCPVVHTFATGETLTAGNLNANPTQWASCFNNLDYRNIGSAGIFPSQLIPTSSAQATFGGTVPLVFTLPPVFSSPLTQANGGTGSVDGSINNISFYVNATPAPTGNPGLETDGYDIDLDAQPGAHIGIGYDDTSLAGIALGPQGNWGNFNGTTTTLNGNLTVTGSGNYVTASNFLASLGQYQLSSATQSSSIFTESNGNIGIYDNTTSNDSGIQFNPSTGFISTNGYTQYAGAGSTFFDLPYDGNSTSGSKTTHLEHGQAIVTFSGSAFGCGGTQYYSHAYAVQPDIVATQLGGGGPSGGVTTYINSRTTTSFQLCAQTNSGSPFTGSITYSTINFGE